MESKKLLEASEYDVDKALEAAKLLPGYGRREAPTGFRAVFTYNHRNKFAAVVILGCQTDFVGQSEAFLTFGNDLAQHIVGVGPQDMKVLLEGAWLKDSAVTVQEKIDDLSRRTQEKITVEYFDLKQA